MAAPSPQALTEVWNRALGERFPLRPELAEQFLSVDVDEQASATAPGGLVVAKSRGRSGQVAALVVEPHVQGRRLGTRLLEHALGGLRRAGVTEVGLGGDFLHLLPGVPEPGPLDFFSRRGFRLDPAPVWDLRRSLAGWAPAAERLELAPASGWPEVLDFLARDFPARWRREADEMRRRGDSPASYLLYRPGGGVAGFVRVHRPGLPSRLIGPSVYWNAGPGVAWGGLGPIGLAPGLRGRGLGGRLLEGALAQLFAHGVREVTADWTLRQGFFLRAGFEPWQSYRPGRRELGLAAGEGLGRP